MEIFWHSHVVPKEPAVTMRWIQSIEGQTIEHMRQKTSPKQKDGRGLKMAGKADSTHWVQA